MQALPDHESHSRVYSQAASRSSIFELSIAD